MYQTATTSHRVDCHDFDSASGEQSKRHTIVTIASDGSTPDHDDRPEGATINSERRYQVATFEATQILRSASSCEIARAIRLPVMCPISVPVDGPDS